MNTIKKSAVVSALLASVVSVSASALGGRDYLIPGYPEKVPGSVCEAGLVRMVGYGPRKSGPYWVCPSNMMHAAAGLRIDTTGQRPRTVVEPGAPEQK